LFTATEWSPVVYLRFDEYLSFDLSNSNYCWRSYYLSRSTAHMCGPAVVSWYTICV